MKAEELDMGISPVSIYHTEIGTFTVYPDFIVNEIKEGVILDFKNCSILIEIMTVHFGKEKVFGYVANRLHSYSVVPTEVAKLKDYFNENCRVAVVTYSPIAQQSARFEKQFCTFNFDQFSDLKSAVLWAAPSFKMVS